MIVVTIVKVVSALLTINAEQAEDVLVSIKKRAQNSRSQEMGEKNTQFKNIADRAIATVSSSGEE